MTFDKFEYDLGNATLTARQIAKLEKDSRFDVGEYMVCTDETANGACKGQILSSLWAFNADFLSGVTGLDSQVFSKLSALCEDANDAVSALVKSTCGIDYLVEQAIAADGRGHVLSSYDGEENEYRVNKSLTLYVYRCN
jgi:hypothetical protein